MKNCGESWELDGKRVNIISMEDDIDKWIHEFTAQCAECLLKRNFTSHELSPERLGGIFDLCHRCGHAVYFKVTKYLGEPEKVTL